MSCIESFARTDLVKREFPIFIDKNHPAFSCETCSVSAHSPGPVSSEEKLSFLVIHPIHFDAGTGTLVPAAFDQVIHRDLSTIRIDHAPESEIRATRQKLLDRGVASGAKLERAVSKCCIVDADVIRNVTDTLGERAVGVYDTGIEDSPHHASIMTTAKVLESRAERMALRLKIFGIFRAGLQNLEI